MSETKHSPEPWFGYDGSHFASTEDGKSVWVGKTALNSDARRIIACVNACAGIPTDALESGALGMALEALYGAWHGDRDDVFGDDEVRECLRSLGRLK